MKLMTNKNTMLLFLLVISTFLMGIGYAAINSVTGEIDVRTTANVQSGVFITSVEPVNVDADDDFITSQIKYYIGTMMQSTVALSKTDSESDIQYKVTFYNNSTESSIFLGVEYVEDYEEFYDNLGITFEISGMNVGDEIGPKETKELTIIFKYKDGVIAENNILNSYLNFKFGQPNRLVLANDNSDRYLNSDVQSSKIEKIEFVLGEVPNEGVIDFFDASEKQDESIIGYYTDDDGNNKYELTFASIQPIYTNIDATDTFSYLTNLKSINFDNFFTSGTTNMCGMFYECNTLASIDLSKFDTSKVTDMSYMFSDCNALTNLNVSNFDTSQVISMASMFEGYNDSMTLDNIIGLNNFNTSQVTDMSWMFSGCTHLTSIDLSKFDTSQVTDMSGMFFICNALTSIDVSNFDTSQVISMASMFEGYKNYQMALNNIIGLNNFNTSQVTDMSWMFSGCTHLTSLDVSKFDTSQVTNMQCMFEHCENVTKLDLNNFDTKNVEDMSEMFNDCNSLIELNISSFETSKVIDMSKMFCACNSIESIDVSKFDTSSVTDMSQMFWQCVNLTSIDVSSFNTSQVTDMSYMFGCYGDEMDLEEIKGLENFDTSNVVSMKAMFQNGVKLHEINVSNFDTRSVTDMSWMFCDCSAITTLDLSKFNTSKVKNMIEMFGGCSNLKTIYVSEYDEINDTGWTTKSVTDSTEMFYNCTSIIGGNGTIFNSNYIDATYARIDKSGNPGYLTNIKESGNVNEKNRLMLADSNSESYLDSGVTKDKIESIAFKLGEVPSQGIISKFDASEKQDGSITGYYTDEDGNSMYELTFISTKQIYANIDSKNLFSYLTNLKSIDLSNFDTSNVTNMNGMFMGCSSLTSIDVNNFNTSEVTDMAFMFDFCISLQSIDLSNFDTNKVTNMEVMFESCQSLESLNISEFNTSNVTNMYAMFYNCSSLTNIDVSKWNTNNVTNMYAMFGECSNLKTIFVSEYEETNDTGWTTKSVTNSTDMFTNCLKIVGGNGTTYNSSYIDAQYARIDKEGSPGYFTDIKDKQ